MLHLCSTSESLLQNGIIGVRPLVFYSNSKRAFDISVCCSTVSVRLLAFEISNAQRVFSSFCERCFQACRSAWLKGAQIGDLSTEFCEGRRFQVTPERSSDESKDCYNGYDGVEMMASAREELRLLVVVHFPNPNLPLPMHFSTRTFCFNFLHFTTFLLIRSQQNPVIKNVPFYSLHLTVLCVMFMHMSILIVYLYCLNFLKYLTILLCRICCNLIILYLEFSHAHPALITSNSVKFSMLRIILYHVPFYVSFPLQ